jgi:hypothetical protein
MRPDVLSVDPLRLGDCRDIDLRRVDAVALEVGWLRVLVFVLSAELEGRLVGKFPPIPDWIDAGPAEVADPAVQIEEPEPFPRRTPLPLHAH